VLQAGLQDNIATVRWAAVTGLGKLGDSSAAVPLHDWPLATIANLRVKEQA